MIVHDKKTTCVHIHPHDEWLVMTASLDCTIKIFDIRMKSTGYRIWRKPPLHSRILISRLFVFNSKSTNAPKALSELSHDQGISSAYFSPKTGSHILSTGNDDIIAIWSGYDNSKSFSKPPARTLKISHNNKTGRWISPFRANFDPTEVFSLRLHRGLRNETFLTRFC
jgi:WD40 repeat protein